MNVNGNGLTRSNWTPNMKFSMEYSRHLCDITRSTTTLMGKSRTRAFSDSEAADYHSHTYHGQYDDFRKRNLTLGGVEGASTQIKVYNLDKKFHRKFGRNEKGKEMHSDNSELDPTLQQVNREASLKHSAYFRMDDDGRSFCDSVSSFAFSDFPNAYADESTKDEVSYKNTKFDAIEKWLQHLPKPGHQLYGNSSGKLPENVVNFPKQNRPSV